MDCPRCKTINLPEWTTCADCGAALPRTAAAAAASASTPVPSVADTAGPLATWAFVFALLFAPVGIVLGLMAKQSSQPGSPAYARANTAVMLSCVFLGLGLLRLITMK